MTKRVILIVLDSVGIGELPDAALYGDEGSDTLGNIARKLGGLRLPNMSALGLGDIEGVDQIEKVSLPNGAYGRCMEVSPGKDTTTGHWEIAGIQLDKAFPTYPDGFPEDVVKEFESLIGTRILANRPASGTAIIQELGDEHVKTGYPIVYTSADSVFQIAAHEDVIPLEKLYEMCTLARNMLKGKHAVGRVIARPFTGQSGNYKRTTNRRDFSLEPIKPTLLNYIEKAGMDVCAVGKIEDIFSGSGINKAVHTKSNMEGVDQTLEYMKADTKGIIFTNLVDFDMLYGHRNNVEGYGRALEEFDNRLPEIMEAMGKDDVLMITADHGCDPTTPSTDHSREYIPILIYGNDIKHGINLGTRKSYSDIGKTIAELLGIEAPIAGESFAKHMVIK
jgi:phosphopentomutase